MIYSTISLSILLLGLGQSAEGFTSPLSLASSPCFRGISNLRAVPEWTAGDGIADVEEQRPMVTVRFINTVTGKDVVAVVEQGSNLLFVGDQAGVKLPRSCRTGLCASCTCEVQDRKSVV